MKLGSEKKLRHVLALLGVLLLLFGVLKEHQEPYLWLFAADMVDPKPAPQVIPLFEGVAVRLYLDTRPHNGKVARLQKGLVLVADGRELVEEGFGLGLPLVEVDGQAHLSRSAAVKQVGDTLVKQYAMDTMDTPSGLLRRKYEPVPPIGRITVSYTVSAADIQVIVDLSGLDPAWSHVYLMNEQGARTFTHYQEPGLVVEGDRLGRWQPTTADPACMLAGDGSLQFCVEAGDDVSKYYGRERYHQYYPVGVYALSWAGIDLELAHPVDRYEYRIRVERPGSE